MHHLHREFVLERDQLLIVKVVEPSHVVVDIDGVLYRARYSVSHDQPPEAPLRKGDHLLIMVHNQNRSGITIVDRVTTQGARDGCTILLNEWEAFCRGV